MPGAPRARVDSAETPVAELAAYDASVAAETSPTPAAMPGSAGATAASSAAVPTAAAVVPAAVAPAAAVPAAVAPAAVAPAAVAPAAVPAAAVVPAAVPAAAVPAPAAVKYVPIYSAATPNAAGISGPSLRPSSGSYPRARHPVPSSP